MKIVNFGSTYKIYGDDLRTYDKLPAATYKVTFHPMSGFALEKVDNFESKEDKIYGSHEAKIKKVLRRYQAFNRSMGIILSGKKGMGKSMFVQLIAEELVNLDIPVIMVTKPFIGIADFIEEIDQECLVIFDEFEKMFGSNRGFGQQQQQNDRIESQDSLLGLFDGTSQKKRMYAITVNDLGRVNDFMLSRPGRFHYHLRFDYPTAAEIEEYLSDKVNSEHHDQIQQVISFANKVKLNYDSLRAISIELNDGETFRSAIGDLNILTTDDQRYNVKIVFEDGKTHDMKGQRLNLFAEEIRLDGYIRGQEGNQYFSVTFDPTAVTEEGMEMYVPGDAIQVHATDEEGDATDDVAVKVIVIKHHYETGVNYRLTV